MIDRKQLRKPDAVYRAAPFWSWNDDLKPRELRRQIDLMKEGGWGGYFMHARVGRITDYLGKPWMKCIDACLKKARQSKTIAYLYDEDKWPSGFAGGIVPKISDAYHVRGLAFVRDDEPRPEDEVIGTWQVEFAHDGSIAHCETDLRGNTKIVAWKAEMGEPWFNNTCYVDLMNGEAVQQFLLSTHEEYAEQFGDTFGQQTLGIFTDEPTVRAHSGTRGASIPFTPRLFDVFQERRGYDVRPHVVSLFIPVGDYRRVRHDYYRTALELFLENFSKPCYDWCEEHNLWLMGHYMAEDNLDYQTAFILAAMPHYEYMHVPGMDHLGRNISNPLTAKQVSSAANQFGRERCMSETYGVSGQNMSFEDRKWIWDWHVALGINLENPHLWLYSMRGERKRDYPPTISHQQPYWGDNGLIAEYSARLSYAMSQGREAADLLLIHPVESAWTEHEGLSNLVPQRPAGGECKRMSRDFAGLLDRFLRAQVTFDLGDETIMARHAAVVEGGRFRIGECTYKAVALPELVTLRTTTLDLLLAFLDAGGAIYSFGPLPTRVDGAKPADTAKLDRLAAGCQAVAPDANPMAAMRDLLDPAVVICPQQAGADKIFATKRVRDDHMVVFLANTDNHKECCLWVDVFGYGVLHRIDLETGQVQKLDYKELGMHKAVQLHFPPAGSHLLWCTPQPERTKGRYQAREAKPVVKTLDGEWDLEVLGANALTLDYVKVDSSDEPTFVLKAEAEIKARRGGAKFELDYSFHVAEKPPSAAMGLVVERFTTKQQIFVNGTEITNAPAEMWFNDVNFLRYDIDGLVAEGENTVKITGAATARKNKEPVVEPVYVVGHFGVARREGGFTIAAAPTKATLHNLTEQGLLFFPGKVKLRRSFSAGAGAKELRLCGVDATVVEAAINGKSLGKRAWRPFDFAIPSGLLQAQNEIELTLTGTLRNLLGPHHHTGGELFSVSPGSFRDYAHFTDDYCFVPFGVKKVALCP